VEWFARYMPERGTGKTERGIGTGGPGTRD